MFAQDFALSRISIKGEVSNCKYHTSGHIYFTLKDGLAAIQAVMFASRRGGLDFELRDGQQVVVKGSVEVYERDGRYQLYASQIALDGAGDLFRRFEKLRNELEEMGEILGASKARILTKITFPLVMPAILSAVIMTFSKAMGTFGVRRF